MQIIVIGERPETEEQLKEIWLHDEILFLDTLEDYQRWCLTRQQVNSNHSASLSCPHSSPDKPRSSAP